MKIKKYVYAVLMIFLIIFTILLSVKHEQKRLSEKMVLQEEVSDEMAVQAAEETDIVFYQTDNFIVYAFPTLSVVME